MDPEQNRVLLTGARACLQEGSRTLDSTVPKPSSTEVHLGAGMRPSKPWLDFGATAVVRNDPVPGTDTLKNHTGLCRLLQGP